MKKKPQLRKYYRPDGSVRLEEYWLDDQLHRTDGPAIICYRPDGSVRLEEYWLDDQLHRTDGPAIIWYNPAGSVERECYFLDHQLHRDSGPAIIWYDEDSRPKEEQYWLDGREIDYFRHTVLTDCLEQLYENLDTIKLRMSYLSGTNVYVVQLHAMSMTTNGPPRFVGVYSTKELADAAGEAALEIYEPGRMTHSVIIAPLDDWVHRKAPKDVA